MTIKHTILICLGIAALFAAYICTPNWEGFFIVCAYYLYFILLYGYLRNFVLMIVMRSEMGVVLLRLFGVFSFWGCLLGYIDLES